MVNQFVKQVGQSAADAAKKMAQQMVREPLEMAKNMQTQVGLPEASQQKDAQDVQIEPTPVSQDQPVNTLDESAIQAEGQRRLAELNSEVKRLIAERKQAEEAWDRQQEQLMGDNDQNPQDKKTLIQPTTKRKQGYTGPAKGKQGTKEMSKSPSG